MGLTEDIKIAQAEQRVFWKLHDLEEERAGERIELMNFLYQLCLAAFPCPSLKINMYKQYEHQQNFQATAEVPDFDVGLGGAYYQRPEEEDYGRELEDALYDIRCTSGRLNDYSAFVGFIEGIVDHATNYKKVYDGKVELFPSSVKDFIEEYDFLLEPIPEDFNFFDATSDEKARAAAKKLRIDLSASTINVKRIFKYPSPLEISAETFAKRVEQGLFHYLKEKFHSDDDPYRPSRETSCKYGIMRFTYSAPYFKIRFDIDGEKNVSLTILGLKQFVDGAIQDLGLGKKLL